MGVKEDVESLSEDDLRQSILIPLLFALGCKDIRDNCGPQECGKDILYLSRDHFLKEKIWGGVILKIGDIKKAVLDTVHRQLSDAINQFVDPDDPRQKAQLHEVLIVTSGEITIDAQKYIHEQSGKNFQNIHFVNGSKLEFLINEVISNYNQKNGKKYIFNTTTFSAICNRPTSRATLSARGQIEDEPTQSI